MLDDARDDRHHLIIIVILWVPIYLVRETA